ncbi:iron-siderophore ABC transporter substrate-binding protein [Citreimonas salinaria]|uniref:Iron complex transport system substrate-binding protein n=1 Tax=Citreimonas salinaria TaxID=321339 RepID=A0A1H3LIK6_9RHOB|nr:iron-siderophore ABC transporter substrate-binding protein [Citreimonas salinaria]SDY64146.1 iron complex transport system substrate-binding protein [Citreimonas salinaria]
MIRQSLAAALLLAALPAFAQDFPVIIPHKFGEAIIEEAPERVASLDFSGADDLLALGIQPVALRHWYGDFEVPLWPWAAPELTSDPVVLRGEIDYEKVAASKPDVILALWSGITQADYEQLSRIAPVVAVPEGVGDYELPWDERARIAGRAVGREDAAEERIAEIDARLTAITEAHPAWDGKTASIAYAMSGTPGVYTSRDIRSQLLARLGFETPPAIDAAAGSGNPFAVALSEEALSIIDADLIFWIATEGDFAPVEALVTRRFLPATRDGHEVFAGELLTGALSHASLLSLPYALDMLVPALEEAMAGNGPVVTE